jgi:hypothetical protein
VPFGRISSLIVEMNVGSERLTKVSPNIGSGIMSMLANAMRYLSLLPVSAMSNARRVQPLRATQLRGARTNCEAQEALASGGTKCPWLSPQPNGQASGARSGGWLARIQANDRPQCS